MLRDVSSIEREIQQIELLSNVVEETADAVIVTDRAGRIEYVNPAFEAASGYARAEVLGRSPSILKPGAHSPAFYTGLWRTLVDGQVFRGTFVNRKKGGELFITEQTIRFDLHGASFVADVTGGDYFDFVPLPGECLGILVGDVSGHGVDSALLMAETAARPRGSSSAPGGRSTWFDRLSGRRPWRSWIGSTGPCVRSRGAVPRGTT